MTEKQIDEGNKLISDFFTAVINHAEIKAGLIYNPWESKWEADGKYHSSWNWIMPIIDDVWKMGYMVNVQYYQIEAGTCTCRIYSAAMHIPAWYGTGSHPITSYFKAVVKFIQWYNSQSKTDNNDRQGGTRITY